MRPTSLRTQITLSKALREEIDQARLITGESLSSYLNNAVRERLEKEKHVKINLTHLAQQVIGSIKKGDQGWGSVTAEEWRKERVEEEKYRQERLEFKHEETYSFKRKKQSTSIPSAFIVRDK